jgi:HEAT repeat protein
LQAEAIPTLVRAIPAVPNRQTRDRLAEALDRLVGANPGYLVDLLSAEDPMLAAEAARIVARIGLREAEPDLVELSKRPEDVTRQAAIEALAILGSAVGAEALATALSDPGKDIRMAAVKAIVAVRPDGAATLLAGIVDRSDLSDRAQGEQMAFMRAYGTLAGDEAVPLLEKRLNGRKWWGGRRAPLTRACAARALGVVGTPAAQSALQKAASDRAAPVKSAVRVALRAIDSDSDERVKVAMLSEEPEEDLVEDPLELDMDIDLDDESGKGGPS